MTGINPSFLSSFLFSVKNFAGLASAGVPGASDVINTLVGSNTGLALGLGDILGDTQQERLDELKKEAERLKLEAEEYRKELERQEEIRKQEELEKAKKEEAEKLEEKREVAKAKADKEEDVREETQVKTGKAETQKQTEIRKNETVQAQKEKDADDVTPAPQVAEAVTSNSQPTSAPSSFTIGINKPEISDDSTTVSADKLKSGQSFGT